MHVREYYKRQEAKNMTTKLIKCRVKGPKGLWVERIHKPDGSVVDLSPESYASKVARGNVYAKGEYEGIQAAKQASLKASQDEKDARTKPDPDDDKEPESEKSDKAPQKDK